MAAKLVEDFLSSKNNSYEEWEDVYDYCYKHKVSDEKILNYKSSENTSEYNKSLDALINIKQIVDDDVDISPYVCLSLFYYLIKKNIKNDVLCDLACKTDNVKCLSLCREYDCYWDDNTYRIAAANSYNCLKYAFDNGCPKNDYAINDALESNNIAALMFLKNVSDLSYNDLKVITDKINKYNEELL